MADAPLLKPMRAIRPAQRRRQGGLEHIEEGKMHHFLRGETQISEMGGPIGRIVREIT
jgi:hypothetical protein